MGLKQTKTELCGGRALHRPGVHGENGPRATQRGVSCRLCHPEAICTSSRASQESVRQELRLAQPADSPGRARPQPQGWGLVAPLG